MTRSTVSPFRARSGIQISTDFPEMPLNERDIPPRSFWLSRSCARDSSAIGDGFCDAAGGEGAGGDGACAKLTDEILTIVAAVIAIISRRTATELIASS